MCCFVAHLRTDSRPSTGRAFFLVTRSPYLSLARSSRRSLGAGRLTSMDSPPAICTRAGEPFVAVLPGDRNRCSGLGPGIRDVLPQTHSLGDVPLTPPVPGATGPCEAHRTRVLLLLRYLASALVFEPRSSWRQARGASERQTRRVRIGARPQAVKRGQGRPLSGAMANRPSTDPSGRRRCPRDP